MEKKMKWMLVLLIANLAYSMVTGSALAFVAVSVSKAETGTALPVLAAEKMENPPEGAGSCSAMISRLEAMEFIGPIEITCILKASPESNAPSSNPIIEPTGTPAIVPTKNPGGMDRLPADFLNHLFDTPEP